MRFDSKFDFDDWLDNKDVCCIEYLKDRSQNENCFEVSFDNDDPVIAVLNKNKYEIFFDLHSEMTDWFTEHQARDIYNKGMSDIFYGFNKFHCVTDQGEVTCIIDSVALI